MSEHERKRKHKRPKKVAGNPWPTWLSQLREQLNLSQEEAAEVVAAPVGTWRGWEYGRRKVSPMIEKLLRLSFPEFFKDKKK